MKNFFLSAFDVGKRKKLINASLDDVNRTCDLGGFNEERPWCLHIWMFNKGNAE